MKVLVVSDLHLEHGNAFEVPEGLDYDAVVLAGDIHSPGRKAVEWARQESTFCGKPVLLVPGNHEFYGCEIGRELEEMKKATHGSRVHVLDRTSVVIGGVRFLGCTLWTDFQLPVCQADGSLEVDVGRALAAANQCMNDFRLIEVEVIARRESRVRRLRHPMRAEDTLSRHWLDRDWLRRELLKRFSGPTVVVTHHGPSKGSVVHRYERDWLAPAFVSDLPEDFFTVPVLWVHGHTHNTFDYQRVSCRVVSNPRGYRSDEETFENGDFRPDLLVDLWQADIIAAAVRVFGSLEAAKLWMMSPAIGLEWQKPVDFLGTPEGGQALRELLGRLEHDVYT